MVVSTPNGFLRLFSPSLSRPLRTKCHMFQPQTGSFGYLARCTPPVNFYMSGTIHNAPKNVTTSMSLSINQNAGQASISVFFTVALMSKTNAIHRQAMVLGASHEVLPR